MILSLMLENFLVISRNFSAFHVTLENALRIFRCAVGWRGVVWKHTNWKLCGEFISQDVCLDDFSKLTRD
jgi:hypothetical protein